MSKCDWCGCEFSSGSGTSSGFNNYCSNRCKYAGIELGQADKKNKIGGCIWGIVLLLVGVTAAIKWALEHPAIIGGFIIIAVLIGVIYFVIKNNNKPDEW
ncbi:MAG: hypothetical protein LBR60_08855 [Fibrobacter sp.]|jgi:hypothetical protein|nr:hypothetical protein [Fibrobacter sp.]